MSELLLGSPHLRRASTPPGGAALEAGRDDPEAYIPRDRRWALSRGAAMPDRVRGSALFADISGFTPLTEALVLELGPQRGAEELTATIDRVFRAVIAELDRFDGNVIYFSGDAITCWLDGDDGRRATAAGLGMQEAIRRNGAIVTPGGGTAVQLELKVAVAVGEARRFLVGDPEIQLIDVLAGGLVDDLAAAEHHAARGELVLDGSAIAALDGAVRLRPPLSAGAGHGVVDRLTVDVAERPASEPPPLPEDRVRPWLLPTIYERIRTGRGEFLAELRGAYPLFVRFTGIDFDGDDDAVAKLDAFIRGAQRILASYGGNLLQLTLGDKGAYLYGAFGSPIAHEDDATRAVAAALELRELERTTAVRDIRIGIGHGRLRSGTYGHPKRRTFVCLGNAVNMAARLMSAAGPGQVLVMDDVRAAAGEGFRWGERTELRVKGRAALIGATPAVATSGRTSRRSVASELPIVGRAVELGILDAAWEESRSGRGRVIGIAAEAGTGKSRLIAEFARSVPQRGGLVVGGECQAYGMSHPYFVWQAIWRSLFGLEVGGDLAEADVRDRLTGVLQSIDPALVPRAPLVGPLLGVPMADTELTATFDPKLRKTSLEDLLAICLMARAAASAVVVVLEDCHWIDDLSRDLLEHLVRSTARSRVLVVLAYRPAAEPGGGLGLERLPQVRELQLDALDDEAASLLIASKADRLFGEDRASRALVDLVLRRTEGNPFYIEELLAFLAARGVDPADVDGIGSVELPASLHSLVLSRVDILAEVPRRTLKVASVVGRDFRAATVAGAYPELGSADAVAGHLDAPSRLDLVTLDRPDELAYAFKHGVVQEVAYESLPFAARATLHRRVGSFIETDAGDRTDRHLDLLAHHFSRSDDEARKRHYLGRAADAAQAAYANSAAIGYYEALAPLLEGAERVAVLLKLGKVLVLAGDWARAEAVETEALELATALGDRSSRAWCETGLAEVARKQGRYEEAAGRLASAEASFRELGDDAGVGQVLHLRGTLAAQQGDYEAAQAAYATSETIRTRIGDRPSLAALWSNLGVIAEYRGDYAAARAWNEQALEARVALDDPWAIGVSQNNLGMIALHERRFEEARDRFEESMRLNREVGDPWMVAIARNNLGNATRGLGDGAAARAHYAAALRAYRDHDDRWALAFLLEDLARLAAADDDPARAFELLGAAETARAGIGSPRGPALEEELANDLREAAAAIGDAAARAAMDRGRGMDLDAATRLASAVCGDASAHRD